MKEIMQLILFTSLLAFATAQDVMQDLYCGDMNCYEGKITTQKVP